MGAGCFAQLAGGFTDALFQNPCPLCKQPLGQRDILNATGEIVNSSCEPASGRPTHSPIPFSQRIGAVAELGSLDLPLQLRLRHLDQAPRNPDRDGLLDSVAGILQEFSQPGPGVLFNASGRHEFHFEDNWNASR